MVHDSGNYWIVDEMTGDMAGGSGGSIPDGGATVVLLGIGLAALVGMRNRIVR